MSERPAGWRSSWSQQFAKNNFDLLISEQGFDALMAVEHRIVAGNLKTKVRDALGKLMPELLKAQAHRELSEPDSANK